RVSEQCLKVLVIPLALIETIDNGCAGLIIVAIEGLADNLRQKQILGAAKEVAQRAWPKDRQVDVGARLDAIIAQRVTEAVGMMRQVEGLALGDVEQATNP